MRLAFGRAVERSVGSGVELVGWRTSTVAKCAFFGGVAILDTAEEKKGTKDNEENAKDGTKGAGSDEGRSGGRVCRPVEKGNDLR